MIGGTHCFILFLLVLRSQSILGDDVRLREKLDYASSFSAESQVSALFASCGETTDFRKVILSFLYFNTMPLKTIFIVDNCETPLDQLETVLPEHGKQHPDLFQLFSIGGGLINTFETVFPLVKTTYLYSNSQKKYVTTSGFGWLEQAIDVLESTSSTGVKVSQVTFFFPQYTAYDYIGQMYKTPSGTKFNFIHTFRPKNRYYFTFKPSVFNVDLIFNQVLGGDIKAFATEKNCDHGDHICMVLNIGKEVT